MSRLSRPIASSLAAFLLASVCAAQQPATKAHGYVAHTVVTATVPNGHPCPQTVIFNAHITANGPADVKYTWVSFDGGSWPEKSVHFPKAGTETVSVSRSVSASGKEWMQLKVLSPNVQMSPRANYTVTCPVVKKK